MNANDIGDFPAPAFVKASLLHGGPMKWRIEYGDGKFARFGRASNPGDGLIKMAQDVLHTENVSAVYVKHRGNDWEELDFAS